MSNDPNNQNHPSPSEPDQKWGPSEPLHKEPPREVPPAPSMPQPARMERELPPMMPAPVQDDGFGALKLALFFLALLLLIGGGIFGLMALNNQTKDRKQRPSPATASTTNDDIPIATTIAADAPEPQTATLEPAPATPNTNRSNPEDPASPDELLAIPPKPSPQPASPASPTPPEPDPEPEVATPAPLPPPAEDPAVRRRQKAETEDILGSLLKLQRKLNDQGAAEWGGEAYARAEAATERGDNAYAEDSFPTATTAYKEAFDLLKGIENQAADAFDDYLDKGAQALASGDAEAAREAFAIALAIDPKDKLAIHGAKRAGTLDQVVDLIDSGSEHETAGRFALAATDYADAYRLDPDHPAARAAHERMQQQMVDQKFRTAMSAGLAALRNKEYDKARAELEEAKAIKPNDPQIEEALGMVDAEVKAAKLHELKALSNVKEIIEDYPAALDLYNQALAVDPNAGFAREGARRCHDAIAANQLLDRFLENPTSLQNRVGLENAVRAIGELRALPRLGPKLSAKIDELDRTVTQATSKTTVRITSDGATNVDVYRVGRFGRMTEKVVQLQPGTYTAVGNRPGFRDVRVSFKVEAGKPAPRVHVACTQPIQ